MKRFSIKQINAAIAPLGVELIKGKGYFYLLDLETGEQVGESIMIYALNHASLEWWLSNIKPEVERHRAAK